MEGGNPYCTIAYGHSGRSRRLVFDRRVGKTYDARDLMMPACRSRGLARILLLWILVLGPFALLESFHAPLPQGVLDGDDDDGAVKALTHLSAVFFETTIPSALPVFVPSSAGLVVFETDRPSPPTVAVPRPSRAPPIL